MYDFLKIFISVLLGMFGKAAFDYVKNRREKKRDKKFIIEYLTSTKIVFPILKENYEKVGEIIPEADFKIHEVKQFEGFNTEVLASLTFPRYYEIFKENAKDIYYIINMVNALKEDLPLSIYEKFISSYEKIDQSLSDEEFEKNVTQKIAVAMANIEIKISEIDILEKKSMSF